MKHFGLEKAGPDEGGEHVFAVVVCSLQRRRWWRNCYHRAFQDFEVCFDAEAHHHRLIGAGARDWS
jgi:hypothetical protein